MKLFPLVNHCNRPPPTKDFCNYLVKSVFFFTGFPPESHWVCKSGGLYISYQYLLTGGQSHLVLFGEKQVLFYFLCQYGRLQNPGETKPHGMKMEKVCPLLVANFKESCGGETFSLCKYFPENIQTRDNDKNLVSGPRKNKTTSTIYPFWVPVKRVVSPHLYASIHIRPLSKPL